MNSLSASTGVLFVIAAGNEGRTGDRTVGSPGSAEAALTVGAVDRQDRLADFSSRGPRIGDYGVKPDVTAPGVDIVAARAKGTGIGTPVDANYTALSGTSMATPHVAGAAALLKQQHPDWTGQRLKDALIGTAKHVDGYSAFEQGAGRIDVDRATTQAVTAAPGNLNTYLPYGGGRSATKTLTYNNSGDTDVRLRLRSHSWTRDGKKADRLVDLDGRKVTVPAHGSVNVDVTLGGRGVKSGVYSGVITAEGGGQAVSAVVGAYVEPAAGDLTATFLRHDGTPQSNLVAMVVDLSSGDQDYLLAGSGTGTLHLPAGKYTLIANIIDKVVVNGESRRRAAPVQVTHGASFQGQIPMYVMPVTDEDVTYQAMFTFGKPKSNLYGTRSPFRVDAAVYDRGEVPADASYHGRTADMAYVDTDIVSHGDAMPMMYAGAIFPDGSAIALNRTFHATGALPHYVDHPEGVDQYRYLVQTDFSGGANVQADTGHHYERGRTYHERWFGFTLGPKADTGDDWRDGDAFHFEPRNLYTDGNPDHISEEGVGYGTMALSRDGAVIASQEFAGVGPALTATLPKGEGRYTLDVHGERVGWLFAARVDVSWTFDSRRTREKTDLPLTTFRSGSADLNGPWTTGPTTTLNLVADGPGDSSPRVRDVTVQVSVDDSAEWTPMPVTKTGGGWTVTVVNPPKTGFVNLVNLRISGTDRDGDSVTQTVYGAYLMQR